MTTPEWLTLIGISTSLIIGIVNLIYLTKNRSNVLREHIFKEQFYYYTNLIKELHILNDCFYELPRHQVLGSYNDEIEQTLVRIYRLTETYDFITPDDLYSPISETLNEAEDLSTKSFKEIITNEDIIAYQKLYFDLVEEIRYSIGIDKLSKENEKLYKSK